MKIGIEIQGIPGLTHAEGQARYAYFLVRALLATAPEQELVLFYNSWRRPLTCSGLASALGNDNFELVQTRLPFTDRHPLASTLKYAWWRARARQLGLDLFHGPSFRALPPGPVPSVVTIHDLAPWLLRLAPAPEAWRRRTMREIERARMVIAISRHGRRRLIELWGIDPGKVAVTHLGFNPPLTKADAMGATAPVAGRFFLYVGSFRANKNIPRLLSGFARVAADHPDLRLVLAGGSDADRARVTRLAARQQIADRVHVPGFVAEERLEDFYRTATALVHPSTYEGFGLTILEAMGRGCPVLCSNAASLPEVAGQAALFFDAADESAIAGAMQRVLRETNLGPSLRARGLERVREFTWEKCARATLEVYMRAVEAPGLPPSPP